MCRNNQNFITRSFYWSLLLRDLLIFFVFFSVIFSPAAKIWADNRLVVDPHGLGKYISGKKNPPDKMVIFVRAASVAPEGSTWFNYATNELIPAVQKVSNNLLDLKLYGGGVMGDEADTIRKMKMGQLHMLGVTNMGLTMMVPELCVFSLPLLFDWEPELFYAGRRTEVDFILEKIEPSIAKLAEKRGFQFMALLETCFEAMGTPFKLQTVEDLQKINFWIWRGDRVRDDVHRVLGIKAMPMELYNVAQALSTGSIDSTMVAWYVSIVLQWWPHVKYVTDYPIYGYESASILSDQRVIDNIVAFGNKWGPKYGLADGEALKKSFLKIADEYLTNLRFMLRKDEVKARNKLLAEGIQEVHFPESELIKLREKIEPLYWELAEKKRYPKSLLEEILKYREQYRELKKQGKLTDAWYDRGIMPDGDYKNEWRE